MNALEILALVNAGLALIKEGMAAIEEANSIITRARAEGRDVTDEEVMEAKAKREDALAKLKEAIGEDE